MQQGMKQTLTVNLVGLEMDSVTSIEFLCKQEDKNSAPVLKAVQWESAGEVTDVIRIPDTTKFAIPFSIEDTFLFLPDAYFYVGARVNFGDSDNPTIRSKPVMMERSLFGPNDDVEQELIDTEESGA